jgi:Tfp pilus assembly protein PilO
MELSKRETYIAIAAAAAFVLLVGDRYVLTPVMESGAALRAEEDRLTGELENATRLFQRRRLMARKWADLTAGGLTSNPAEAESRLLHAMQDWAASAGLTLSAVKPERTEQTGRTREIRITASGTGSMRAVARFLYLAETTSLPLRIGEIQLGARRAGADDLSLQLRASTLYLGEEAPRAEAPEAQEGEP